jgi:predicted transcriptional regulator
MPRPANPYPTPAELKVLHLLWDEGPRTVRELLKAYPQNAYTTVMSLCNVLHEKGLCTRAAEGRAFRYTAKVTREQVQQRVMTAVFDTVFARNKEALTKVIAKLK